MAAQGAPAPPPGAGLSVGVLGKLTAARSGELLDLGGPRRRAVLALLIIARGEVVSAGRLVQALWGDEAGASKTSSLQASVSHLRRILDPGRGRGDRGGIVVSEASGYAFRAPPDTVDAWCFERSVAEARTAEPARAVCLLQDALGRWRGPAYAEYIGEGWARPAAGRLEELREVAREQLMAARLESGESAVLVPDLEALLETQPLREERWRLLVLALYRSGRQADALEALRRARTVLAEALGVDPGPALRALEEDVLAQAPALEVTPRPRIENAGIRPPAPPTAMLVDREGELRTLGHALDGGVGAAPLLLLDGPAGIGKSRLLAEFRRMAEAEGLQTLAARGSRLEREYAFGVVRQLFEPALADPQARARLLSGRAAPARAVFEDAAQDGAERGSFAVLDGLYRLTAALSADRPLVLLVDDLQWSDPGSLRFLAYLVRRLEGVAVGLAVAVRAGEAQAEPDLVREVTDDPAVLRIRPAPLTPEGVTALVRERFGGDSDAGFAAACHRLTSGNPLLVRQLLHAMEVEGLTPDAAHAGAVTAVGSRAVSGMVLPRLARLPVGCRSVARAVAVLGEGAELPQVAALTGQTEDDVARAATALAGAEILRDAYPLGFVHPLVHEAIQADVPAGERALEHDRAARLLDGAGAPAERIAAHLLQVPARGDSWTVRQLRRAAATARERGAAESAVSYLRRALAEPPSPSERPTVLADLGRLEDFTDGPAAQLHLRQAYETATDARQRAELALALTRNLVFTGHPGEAGDFARRVPTELPAWGLAADEADDLRQGLLALDRYAGVLHGREVQPGPGAVASMISGSGVGARALAAQSALELFLAGEARERATGLARFALGAGPAPVPSGAPMQVTAVLVLDLCEADTTSLWTGTLAAASARGSTFAAMAAHLWHGYHLWRRGELAEAERSLGIAIDQAQEWGNSGMVVPYGHAWLLGVLLDRGNQAGARAHRDRLPRRLGTAEGAALFAQATVALLVAEERHREALVLLDETRSPLAMAVNPAWNPWRSLRARALAGLGRRDEAIALVEEEVALGRRWGAPAALGSRLRLLGELRGHPGAGELREAVDVLTGSVARLELARACFALGRTGPPDAVPLLRQAVDLAADCGAERLRAEAAGALAAAGAGARAPRQEGRGRQGQRGTGGGEQEHRRRVGLVPPEGRERGRAGDAADVTARRPQTRDHPGAGRFDRAERSRLHGRLRDAQAGTGQGEHDHEHGDVG